MNASAVNGIIKNMFSSSHNHVNYLKLETEYHIHK